MVMKVERKAATVISWYGICLKLASLACLGTPYPVVTTAHACMQILE